MRNIRRPDNLEPVVERLTNPENTGTRTPVFRTIMDLLIFAAGVGLRHDRHLPVPSSGKEVPIRVFENNQKDGYLYLVALATKQDPAVLEEKNDDEIAKIFEEYAAGGLEQINDWLTKNANDFSGVDTILAEMQNYVPLDPQEVENPNPL